MEKIKIINEDEKPKNPTELFLKIEELLIFCRANNYPLLVFAKEPGPMGRQCAIHGGGIELRDMIKDEFNHQHISLKKIFISAII